MVPRVKHGALAPLLGVAPRLRLRVVERLLERRFAVDLNVDEARGRGPTACLPFAHVTYA